MARFTMEWLPGPSASQVLFRSARAFLLNRGPVFLKGLSLCLKNIIWEGEETVISNELLVINHLEQSRLLRTDRILKRDSFLRI